MKLIDKGGNVHLSPLAKTDSRQTLLKDPSEPFPDLPTLAAPPPPALKKRERGFCYDFPPPGFHDSDIEIIAWVSKNNVIILTSDDLLYRKMSEHFVGTPKSTTSVH